MNKQEAIKKLKHLKCRFKEGNKDNYNYGFINALNYALNIVKQIQYHEKPVVPKFVADYYESIKDNFEHKIYRLCVDFNNKNLDKDLSEWFNHLANKPIETLVNMHHFGYEIKKESLYIVKFSNEDLNNLYIGIHRDTNQVDFSVLPVNDENIKSWFTEWELKKFNFWENPAFIVEKVK